MGLTKSDSNLKFHLLLFMFIANINTKLISESTQSYFWIWLFYKKKIIQWIHKEK